MRVTRIKIFFIIVMHMSLTQILFAEQSEIILDKIESSMNNNINLQKNNDNVWLKIESNKQRNDFEYSSKGYITYKGKKCLDQIVYTIYINDKPEISIPPTIYISPQSPNKRFVFITGCEETDIKNCNFRIFKLLDLNTMEIFEANHSHYGPEMWVKWSKTNKYAILHDPESGLMQSVNLETKEIITLPLAERNGVGTIYNLSSENSYGALWSKNQWAEVDEKTFKWNKDETKFYVKMNVMNENHDIIRSYNVEADLQTGRVLEVK